MAEKSSIKKGQVLDREMLEAIESKVLRKAEVSAGSIDIAAEVKEYEQRTERQINILSDIYDEKITKLQAGRRTAAGRDQDGQGLRRHEAQAFGRRQDGRTPR